MIHTCKFCCYSTDKLCNLTKHNETKKHAKNVINKAEKDETIDNAYVDTATSNTPICQEIKSLVKKELKKSKKKKQIAKKQCISQSLKLKVWDYWIGKKIGCTQCRKHSKNLY